MKKALTRNINTIYHYKVGKRIEGAPPDVRGDLSGVSGDLDDCEITDEERKKGIDIEDLIK